MRTQFTTRLPEPLAAALAAQAQANHRSANAELTAILAGALSGTPSTPPGWFSAGDTFESGDCGNFEAGIDHLTLDGNVLTPTGVGTNPNKPPKLWGQRIAVYGNTAEQAEALRDIILTALNSTPTLAPYKAALQRLIDDSAALREKYEDMDEAVEMARGLL